MKLTGQPIYLFNYHCHQRAIKPKKMSRERPFAHQFQSAYQFIWEGGRWISILKI